MNKINNFKLISVSTLLALGLSACEKPGPAESVGKKIDTVTNEAEEKMGETTEKIAAAVNDAEITTGACLAKTRLINTQNRPRNASALAD